MNHIADLAESLDDIRDCVVELESGVQNANEGEADLHLTCTCGLCFGFFELCSRWWGGV